jgi:hypothetical protein
MNAATKGKHGLCNQDIRDIRIDKNSYDVIAEKYSITVMLVQQIKHRKVWGYVP